MRGDVTREHRVFTFLGALAAEPSRPEVRPLALRPRLAPGLPLQRYGFFADRRPRSALGSRWTCRGRLDECRSACARTTAGACRTRPDVGPERSRRTSVDAGPEVAAVGRCRYLPRDVAAAHHRGTGAPRRHAAPRAVGLSTRERWVESAVGLAYVASARPRSSSRIRRTGRRGCSPSSRPGSCASRRGFSSTRRSASRLPHSWRSSRCCSRSRSSLVPVVVPAVMIAARLPELWRGEQQPARLLKEIANSWFVIGPVALFAAVWNPPRSWPARARSLLALLAQFVVDAGSSRRCASAWSGRHHRRAAPRLMGLRGRWGTGGRRTRVRRRDGTSRRRRARPAAAARSPRGRSPGSATSESSP